MSTSSFLNSFIFAFKMMHLASLMDRRSEAKNLKTSAEIIPNRLYFICLKTAAPRNTTNAHFFTIDNVLVYEPFFADFGPLNLGYLYRFCRSLKSKLKKKRYLDKKIYFYTSFNEHKRANAAFLIGSYSVLFLGMSAADAWKPLSNMKPDFFPFRDAGMHVCTYHMTVRHCIQAVEKARDAGFLDFNTFDVNQYEYYEQIENGDFNFITPKFLAFSGPSQTRRCPDGSMSLTPQDYITVFKHFKISTIIRLNMKAYDKKGFTDQGFEHYDMYFVDGTTPTKYILDKFMEVCENAKGVIAVHCKAGLGRTGTLIGSYIIKHYKWNASDVIAWLRICRPGSVIGPQQDFLEQQTEYLWKQGDKFHSKQDEQSRPEKSPTAALTEVLRAATPSSKKYVRNTKTTYSSTLSTQELKQQEEDVLRSMSLHSLAQHSLAMPSKDEIESAPTQNAIRIADLAVRKEFVPTAEHPVQGMSQGQALVRNKAYARSVSPKSSPKLGSESHAKKLAGKAASSGQLSQELKRIECVRKPQGDTNRTASWLSQKQMQRIQHSKPQVQVRASPATNALSWS